jgi:hypothetical protein
MGDEQSDRDDPSADEFYLRDWIMDEEQLFHVLFALMYLVPIVVLSVLAIYGG